MSERAHARDAERMAQESARLAEIDRPWREFCEARGGWSTGLYDEVLAHTHPAHGFGAWFDARGGRLIGVGSVALTDEDMAREIPEACPICRDVQAGAWRA